MEILNNILNFILNLFGSFATLLQILLNIVILLLNLLIQIITGLVSAFVNFFPDSPFIDLVDLSLSIKEPLQYLSWLIPIKFMFSILTAWCGCMVIYYGYGFIMRWMKIID